MLQHNIKSLRLQNGLTQKQLADELHVTPQAVSRWENGEVEPSVSAIGEMAKIFNVSYDELMRGKEDDEEKEELASTSFPDLQSDLTPLQSDLPPIELPPNNDETPFAIDLLPQSSTNDTTHDASTVTITDEKQQTDDVRRKPILWLCDECGKPLYSKKDIVHKRIYSNGVKIRDAHLCKTCGQYFEQNNGSEEWQKAKTQRTQSFAFGTAIFVAILAIGIFVSIKYNLNAGIFAAIFALDVCAFTFSSCLLLRNNFIEDVFLEVSTWGVVKFPGLIFSFSLDGFAWLIGMKILFWVIGLALGILAVLLALAICLPLSFFVYPFALRNSFIYPEKSC